MTLYRFKTQKEIRDAIPKELNDGNWTIEFLTSRGPYIYTSKIFRVIKQEGHYSIIENIVSKKRHKVFSFALKKWR